MSKCLYRTILTCFLALTLVVLSGCPPTQQIRKPIHRTAQQWIRTIQKKRRVIHSLEGRAKLRIYQPNKKRRTLRMYFQLQRPNKIHLQVIAAAMQPVLAVTCDGKNFAIHNMLQNQFIRGKARQLPQFLHEYLAADIPLEQLIGTLLGEFPLLPYTQVTRQESTKDTVKLLLSDPTHTQKIWLSPTKQQYIKTEVKVKKRPTLILEYGTHRGTPPLPKRIKFIVPEKKKRVHWIFSQRIINPKLTTTNFQQNPPKGSTIQDL